ncbi:MAG: NIPSNAP family protein [Isosphaeraceae bacterium]|nr:NIPSNAP family protein [Isosphaeraceae bacterium]
MNRIVLLSVLLTFGAVLLATGRERDQSAAPSTNRVFELRTYYTNEGKLDDLHKRFRDHTCKLFQKHGIELVGFWTPQDEKDGKADKLIYIIAFPSREAAKASWKAFQEDPEWQKVKEESHKNGVLVKKVDSVYLDPTDYSAIK